jgi:hypothetical protein
VHRFTGGQFAARSKSCATVRLAAHLDQEDETFTGTTRRREQTILLYVRRLADHEREHLAQLATTVHTE